MSTTTKTVVRQQCTSIPLVMQSILKESVWTVIGAGPCGIASVGRLLDLNVKKVIILNLNNSLIIIILPSK